MLTHWSYVFLALTHWYRVQDEMFHLVFLLCSRLRPPMATECVYLNPPHCCIMTVHTWVASLFIVCMCLGGKWANIYCSNITLGSRMNEWNITEQSFSQDNIGILYMIVLNWMQFNWYNIDGLVQERCNSSALAMELCLSCTNPSI